MRFREFAQLLFELNVSTRRRAIARFRAENPQLTDDEITLMLDKWERYINRMPADVRDVNAVSWQQLTTAVDDAEALAKLGNYRGQTDPANLVPIYNNNNLVIYRGDSKPKCIHYGQGYSWCISRTDASNLFNNYRYGRAEPMFYFVFDRDRDQEDDWHAVVIHVSKNGEFAVTTSSNDVNRTMSWRELVSHHPKLADLKHVFQPQPLTDQEREDYDRFRQPMSREQWDNLTVREKIRAIEFGMQLSDEQQASLPYPFLKLYLVNNISFLSRDSWLRLKSGDFSYGMRLLRQQMRHEELEDLLSKRTYWPDYFDSDFNDQHRQAILYQFATGPNADSNSAMFYLEKMAEQRESRGLVRWPAAEHVIATSSVDAVVYAQFVLKGRWPKPHRDIAEENMAEDGHTALQYAHVLGGRWPEPHRDTAERNIAQYSLFIERYSRIIGIPEQELVSEIEQSRTEDVDQHPQHHAEDHI